MAKLKGAALLRKQKDAKQKKLLLVLIPVFVLLLVWQGPSYLKMLKGDDTAATPAETSPSTDTLPDGTPPDPSTAPPPSTTVPGDTQPGVPTDGSTSLPDSDQPSPADSGQLVSFERFVGKDPFKQLVDTSPAVTEPTITPVPNPGGTGGTPSPDPDPDDDGSDDDPVPVAAVIKVNGKTETVTVDGEFPKDEELFVVKRLTARSAWIGLVSGEFSNGKDAIEVDVGDTLNLVSQPDGIRYTIKVLRISLQ